ncbi:MAG: hotdog fold domain-containing protein [Pseudomonadota bacterium]
MHKISLIFSTWQRTSNWIGGKWLFSRIICWMAPYFGTIRPQFVALRPGYCELQIKKRRAVLNHIGTVHAIAMCNMAELAAGTLTDVTIPATHRWIPKGMTVEYLKKAATNLRAIAALESIPAFAAVVELPVTVKVMDMHDQIVFRAVITMLISPKKA